MAENETAAESLAVTDVPDAEATEPDAPTESDVPEVPDAQPETILVKGEGGTIFEMALPLHETIEDKLRKGHLQRVDGKGNVVPTGTDGVPGPPDKRPALSANKAEWVGWAVAQGAAPDDAEAMSKTDLIEKYGSGD